MHKGGQGHWFTLLIKAPAALPREALLPGWARGSALSFITVQGQLGVRGGTTKP